MGRGVELPKASAYGMVHSQIILARCLVIYRTALITFSVQVCIVVPESVLKPGCIALLVSPLLSS